MRIHKFEHGYNEFQLIDLDYIVSIGPITDFNLEPSLSFTIYLKLGNPIALKRKYSETYISSAFKSFEKERDKLIAAWESLGK